MKRKQFTFYRSFFEAMMKLPEEMWLAYLVNIVSYGLDGETMMKMNFTQDAMFELVRPNLDAARKKAEAGAAGGRCGKASKQVSKREKEKEIEIENEIETETENDSGQGKAASGRGSVWLGFERFWNQYPVKIGKEEAWEQWQRLCPEADAVCDSLEAWKRTGQWLKEKGRYVPRAAKFLEQEHYLQKPQVQAAKTASCTLGQAEIEALEKIMREDTK